MGEDGISVASFLVFCRRTTAKDLCSELNRERQKPQPQSPSIFYKRPRTSPRYYAYDREETFQGLPILIQANTPKTTAHTNYCHVSWARGGRSKCLINSFFPLGAINDRVRCALPAL